MSISRQKAKSKIPKILVHVLWFFFVKFVFQKANTQPVRMIYIIGEQEILH